MIVPVAVMVNILAERSGEVDLARLSEAKGNSRVTVHWYGKKEARPDRKMGHITILGEDPEETKELARAARAAISV